MSLGLAMIVRDEAAVIERCLASVRPHIDHWTIIDTGSTDSTPGLIPVLLEGIPGHLGRAVWQDFGTNRTDLLNLARGKTDWILCLDADMTLEHAGPFPAFCEAGLVTYEGGLDYSQPLLVKGDVEWRYIGKTHEYLTTEQVPFRTVAATGWRVRHWGDGANRAAKAQRDIELLLPDASQGDHRAMFYLAQSYRDAGDVERARFWYEARAELDEGWIEERYCARLYQADCSEDDDALLVLAEATRLVPGRAEAYYRMGKRLQNKQVWDAARAVFETGLACGYPTLGLFVERWVYEWALLLERGVSAYYAGDPGRLKADMLMLNANLPTDVREQVRTNLEAVA